MTWFDQFGLTEALFHQILRDALGRGADDGDLYLEHATSCSVTLSNGKVSDATTSIDLGLGVRAVHGDSVGYAYTEDLSIGAMREAAQVAAEIAAGGQAREVAAIGSRGLRQLADRYAIRTPWEGVDMAQRVSLVRAWEQAAFARDSRVRRVEAMLTDAQRHILIVRPDGRMVYDYQPMTRALVAVTAEQNGKKESSKANIAQRRGLEFYSPANVAHVVNKAVDDTMMLFEAVKPPAGEMTVVLGAGASGILLHEAIGHGLEADLNRKGTSIYADKVGQRVAPPGVTLVDDGTMPHARGSLNTDDEGNAAERTVLVEDGILRGYLHDEISARHYGVAPTGSGRRESFRKPVLPRMRTTFIENGTFTPDEIIASVKNGIYCSSFLNGQVQIGAGDFAFYVQHGYLIEDGKLTRPIKDVNIVGNGPKVLETVNMVGNDLKIDIGGWTCGKDGQKVPVSQGMPTIKVEKLSVGGAS